jgi:hypothetical protein
VQPARYRSESQIPATIVADEIEGAHTMKNRNHASAFTKIAVEFKTREEVPFTLKDL